jgi:hypothetical protein
VQHGEAPEMREVMEATRAAEEPLVAAAKAVLERAGHAATLEQLRRVRETLHAAAVGSDALREELGAGRLTRDLEMPSLLDIAAGLPEVPPPVGDLGEAPPEPETKSSTAPTRPAMPAAKMRRAAEDLEDARKAREEAAEKARRAQEEERERARKAREEQMRVAAVREADRRVAEREKALAEAEIAVARAREALEDARAARAKLG